jgi:hypothetical protein
MIFFAVRNVPFKYIMYRNRYRCYDRGFCGGGYPYYPSPYLYQAYLNSNLYDYYYPSYPVMPSYPAIAPYYANPYFY